MTQQDHVRDRGGQPLARRRRLRRRHRHDLAGDPRAVEAGIVVAVAAGNAGPGTCTVGTPGAAPAALTVGRDDRSRPRRLLPRVVLEPRPDARRAHQARRRRPRRLDTSIGARTRPTATRSTAARAWRRRSSCGVALLMRDANPSLTPQQIKDPIKSTAVDWGPPGADSDYGAGRLDAYAALRAAGAPLGRPGLQCPTHTLPERHLRPQVRAPTSSSTSPTRSTRSRRR